MIWVEENRIQQTVGHTTIIAKLIWIRKSQSQSNKCTFVLLYFQANVSAYSTLALPVPYSFVSALWQHVVVDRHSYKYMYMFHCIARASIESPWEVKYAFYLKVEWCVCVCVFSIAHSNNDIHSSASSSSSAHLTILYLSLHIYGAYRP